MDPCGTELVPPITATQRAASSATLNQSELRGYHDSMDGMFAGDDIAVVLHLISPISLEWCTR
ncbi:hypothetical protein M404DRAFT_1000338 [Pisolithus tinctorius Marx 270]|uniref:Uncharacterized protein n=1 Tax=Pisolithus tinctorius Marx 270 TaxID=870435 RepID=A0A0C3NVA2_PISTI|nr:hypothetical protein M404DRAFT_1000338 [Pisolithus tinctorius Marx 270]